MPQFIQNSIHVAAGVATPAAAAVVCEATLVPAGTYRYTVNSAATTFNSALPANMGLYYCVTSGTLAAATAAGNTVKFLSLATQSISDGVLVLPPIFPTAGTGGGNTETTSQVTGDAVETFGSTNTVPQPAPTFVGLTPNWPANTPASPTTENPTYTVAVLAVAQDTSASYFASLDLEQVY